MPNHAEQHSNETTEIVNYRALNIKTCTYQRHIGRLKRKRDEFGNKTKVLKNNLAKNLKFAKICHTTFENRESMSKILVLFISCKKAGAPITLE